MKTIFLLAALAALIALAAAQATSEAAPVASEAAPAVSEGAATPAATYTDMPKLEEEGAGLVVPEFETFGEFRDWLMTLTPAQRIEMFEQGEAGPMPMGIYTGFMLSDRPNYEDFDISITNKAVMTFVFDRWIGKTFDGEGNLQNILRDEQGFTSDDLKGELILKEGYVDDEESWIAEYGADTKYNFILDEFREIRPGFLYGITFLVPAEKGDKAFFECGLVKIGDKAPKGTTPSELILENIAAVEETPPEGAGSEGVPVVSAQDDADSEEAADSEETANSEGSYEEDESTESEEVANSEDAAEEVDSELKTEAMMPEPEAEAMDMPEAESLDSMMD